LLIITCIEKQYTRPLTLTRTAPQPIKIHIEIMIIKGNKKTDRINRLKMYKKSTEHYYTFNKKEVG